MILNLVRYIHSSSETTSILIASAQLKLVGFVPALRTALREHELNNTAYRLELRRIDEYIENDSSGAHGVHKYCAKDAINYKKIQLLLRKLSGSERKTRDLKKK
jgi:hypothetical protein